MNLHFSVPRNFTLTRRGSQRSCFPQMWPSAQTVALTSRWLSWGFPSHPQERWGWHAPSRPHGAGVAASSSSGTGPGWRPLTRDGLRPTGCPGRRVYFPLHMDIQERTTF